MKKSLALTPLLVLLTAAAWGASTNTPTNTPIPTNTPTVTLTPTNTYTPIPLSSKDQRYSRLYIQPRDVRASDSITAPATTPTPGGVWLAQDSNIASFVMGTGTAGAEPKVRVKWTVPADFSQSPLIPRLWMTGVNSSATNTVQIAVNAYVLKRAGAAGVLTATAMTNYTNVKTMLGVTTNVQTQSNAYSLAKVTYTAKRFLCAMPLAITQVASGDEVSFEIVRSGTSGNLSIFSVEVEYDRKNFLNP